MVEHINPFKLSGLLEEPVIQKPAAPAQEPVKKAKPKSAPRAKKEKKKKA